jgi:hypothetical protein
MPSRLSATDADFREYPLLPAVNNGDLPQLA